MGFGFVVCVLCLSFVLCILGVSLVLLFWVCLLSFPVELLWMGLLGVLICLLIMVVRFISIVLA